MPYFDVLSLLDIRKRKTKSRGARKKCNFKRKQTETVRILKVVGQILKFTSFTSLFVFTRYLINM